jgi:hypothetical protein
LAAISSISVEMKINCIANMAPLLESIGLFGAHIFYKF